MLNYNVLAFRIRKQNQNISFRSKVILILVKVAIFLKNLKKSEKSASIFFHYQSIPFMVEIICPKFHRHELMF